jgi:hypothetical protein
MKKKKQLFLRKNNTCKWVHKMRKIEDHIAALEL